MQAKNLAEDGTEILSRLATFLAQKVEKNERKAATASGVEVIELSEGCF